MNFVILLVLLSSVAIVAQGTQLNRSLKNRLLYPRLDSENVFCGGDNLDKNVLSRFGGIVFGDFITGDGWYSKVPLAVGGNMKTTNYVVNSGHGAVCTDPNSVPAYGLVVGGQFQSTNLTVYGSVLLPNGAQTQEINQEVPGCIVSNTLNTGQVNFDDIKRNRLLANQAYAEMPPTLVINSNLTVTRVREPINGEYEVFQFNSCRGKVCSDIFPGQMSDASRVLFTNYNYDGLQDFTYNPDMIYVFNMPVLTNGSIRVITANPSLGFDPCKLVYNPYPVDTVSHAFNSNGEFTYTRETNDVTGGYTLAPRAHIIDSLTGTFGGNFVGLDYTWYILSEGIPILDYQEAGGNCDSFAGCIQQTTTTSTITSSQESSTSGTGYSTLSGTFTDQTPSTNQIHSVIGRSGDRTLEGTLTNQTPSRNSEFSTVTNLPTTSSSLSTTTTTSSTTAPPQTCIPTLTVAGEPVTNTLTGNGRIVTVNLLNGPSTFTMTKKVTTIEPPVITTNYTQHITLYTFIVLSTDSTFTITTTVPETDQSTGVCTDN